MTDWIERTVESLGYFGVALLTFLENLFPPIPSEVVLPLAGFAASRGELLVSGTVFAGAVGSLVGTSLYYFLGRAVREETLRGWVRSHGRWIGLRESDLTRAMRWFQRRGRWALLVCRFIPGIRTLVSVPAGLCHTPLPTFFAYSAAGIFIWTAALTYAGAALGENYERVGEYMAPLSWIVVGLLAAAFVALSLRRPE